MSAFLRSNKVMLGHSSLSLSLSYLMCFVV